ncbi:isochorismatase family cysteine hydrolase [Actinospica sp.]|uniref:cysteine hydrolase family protein n=1 Tax=Actinospica sp. TaxID=1872142 RepID=UPI002C3C3615|nr:isochorismatase family cysteine hydrolase [Actinospica sp.]HWG24590.1 isochorismatase family cysteine hydrolase [Actinospica sp.]
MVPRTALIVIDMQNMYLDQERRDRYGWPAIYRLDETVAQCAALLRAARAESMPIIYTRAVSRADGADTMPAIDALRRAVNAEADPVEDETAWTSAIMDAVAPEPGDIVLTKPRWDAFFATELENILRRLDVNRLLIAGLQTNVCVDSTARAALMRNFEVAVSEDAVSTDGKHLHFNGLNALRVLYAEVAPWRELLAEGADWTRRLVRPGYGRHNDALPHPDEPTESTEPK